MFRPQERLWDRTWELLIPALVVSRAVEVTIDPEWVWAVGCLCLVHATAALVYRSRSEYLPDIMVDEDSNDGMYDVGICDNEALSEANALTKPYYRGEYVPDDVAETWRKKNPRGFVSIRNTNGVLCAAFGVLALDESFGKQFVKGRVLDNELEGDDIKGYEESRKSRELYISGVVVREPEGAQGKRRACVMFWAMVEYLRAIYGVRRRRTIYALAVSKKGEAVLRRFGFRVVSAKHTRRDGLDLYSLELDASAIAGVAARIGDWSQSVRSGRIDVS